MANMAVKIALFSILLNLMSGILITGVVNSNIDTNGTISHVFDAPSTTGMSYDANYGRNITIINELQDPINPSGTSVEDAGDRIYRLLDSISLGFIFRFITSIKTYMFGFVMILGNTIGPFLEPSLRNMLFGTESGYQGLFHFIVVMAYIIAGISMFTGKNITGED